MNEFREIAEVFRLLLPIFGVFFTILVAAAMWWARKVLVFRDEMYDRATGKRIYCSQKDLNAAGESIRVEYRALKKEVDMIDRSLSATNERSIHNERVIEVMKERDQNMVDRFSREVVAPLRQLAKDMSDVRDRLSRIEGQQHHK